jgi:hypothetical protein
MTLNEGNFANPLFKALSLKTTLLPLLKKLSLVCIGNMSTRNIYYALRSKTGRELKGSDLKLSPYQAITLETHGVQGSFVPSFPITQPGTLQVTSLKLEQTEGSSLQGEGSKPKSSLQLEIEQGLKHPVPITVEELKRLEEENDREFKEKTSGKGIDSEATREGDTEEKTQEGKTELEEAQPAAASEAKEQQSQPAAVGVKRSQPPEKTAKKKKVPKLFKFVD